MGDGRWPPGSWGRPYLENADLDSESLTSFMPQADHEPHFPATFIFDEQFALCCDDRAKYQDTQGKAKTTPCTGVVAKAGGTSVSNAVY
jgi:hypothetical protein